MHRWAAISFACGHSDDVNIARCCPAQMGQAGLGTNTEKGTAEANYSATTGQLLIFTSSYQGAQCRNQRRRGRNQAQNCLEYNTTTSTCGIVVVQAQATRNICIYIYYINMYTYIYSRRQHMTWCISHQGQHLYFKDTATSNNKASMFFIEIIAWTFDNKSSAKCGWNDVQCIARRVYELGNRRSVHLRPMTV